MTPSLLHRAMPIVRRLRRAIRPRHVRFYLVSRDLRTLEDPRFPPDTSLVTVTRTSDQRYGDLVEICGEHGLDREWVDDNLAAGGSAGLVLVGSEVAAFGWVTTQPFYVAEIAHTFNPGLGGCYIFALYVRPRYRGRGLAQMLEARRLVQTRAAFGSQTAYGLIDSTNTASFRSHFAWGFAPALRIDLLHLSPRHVLAHLRRIGPSRPQATLVPNGFHFAPSLHLVHPD